MSVQPSGLLIWGQAGEYNAPDDRLVITALADHRTGLVTELTLSAGSGLIVNMSGGWIAVADCGDGTSAIIGTRHAMQVQVNAGSSSGARTDYIWADVDPDGATWEVNVIPSWDTVGRAGLRLGTITVPQNANLASQMQLTPARVSFGHFRGLTIETPETNGEAAMHATATGGIYQRSHTTNMGGNLPITHAQPWEGQAQNLGTLSPYWLFPAADAKPRTQYRLKSFGTGRMGNPSVNMWFEPYLNMTRRTGVTVGTSAIGANQGFSWDLECTMMVRDNGHQCQLKMTVVVSDHGTPARSWHGTRALTNVEFPTTGLFNFMTYGGFSTSGIANQYLITLGSTMERLGGGDPGPSVIQPFSGAGALIAPAQQAALDAYGEGLPAAQDLGAGPAGSDAQELP